MLEGLIYALSMNSFIQQKLYFLRFYTTFKKAGARRQTAGPTLIDARQVEDSV